MSQRAVRTSKVPSGLAISAGAGRFRDRSSPKMPSPPAAAPAAAVAAAAAVLPPAVSSQRDGGGSEHWHLTCSKFSFSAHMYVHMSGTICTNIVLATKYECWSARHEPCARPQHLKTFKATEGTISNVAHGGVLRPGEIRFHTWHVSPTQKVLLVLTQESLGVHPLYGGRTKNTKSAERPEEGELTLLSPRLWSASNALRWHVDAVHVGATAQELRPVPTVPTSKTFPNDDAVRNDAKRKNDEYDTSLSPGKLDAHQGYE